VSPRRVTVIPNGVDLGRVAFDAAARERVRAEHGIGSGDYVIGVLGRLDPNKRFDLVIEAAAPLLNGTTKLMIVGKGDEHQHLAAVAAAHGVSDRVVFTGERHDVAAMLSALDCSSPRQRRRRSGCPCWKRWPTARRRSTPPAPR
jgi:glycosyltransferase involved in cell wall biosynthesis